MLWIPASRGCAVTWNLLHHFWKEAGLRKVGEVEMMLGLCQGFCVFRLVLHSTRIRIGRTITAKRFIHHTGLLHASIARPSWKLSLVHSLF